MNRDLGLESIPIEYAVFLLTRDFHADICTEQIEFDLGSEIAELENVLAAIFPTPSFDRQGHGSLGKLKQVLRAASSSGRKTLCSHPSLTIPNLSVI